MKDETMKFVTDTAAKVVQSVRMVRDDTSEAMASKDVTTIITHYSKLRGVVETIKTARKALDEIEERMSRELIPSFFRDNAIKNVNVEGVGRVTVSYRFSCSIIDDPVVGKQRGYDYLIANNSGSLITQTVNSSSLAAHAKNLIENEGVELPQDIFKTSSSPFTSITKG